MPILAAGPFAITQTPETGVLIRAPLRPQGDWLGTPEGRAEMTDASERLALAAKAGKLPPGTHIEATSDADLSHVIVPMQSWDIAQKDKESIRTEVLTATKAVKTDNIPRTRSSTSRDDDFHSR